MLRTIILLTNRFPYAGGEEFLETEIKYLASVVDRVLVVPVKMSGVRRPLPNNVEVVTDLAEKSAQDSKFGKLLAALLLLTKNPGAFRLDINYLKALLIAEYYSDLAMKLVPNIIHEHDLLVDSTVCYCYWFSGLVAGLVKLRDSLEGLRVVTRAHGMDLYESRLSLPEFPFRKKIIGQLDAVFCVSAHGKRHLDESFGAPNIVLSRLGTRRPDTLPARNASRPRVLIVSCSGIKRVKRLDRIVEAIGALSARYPSTQFEWNHIGDGELSSDILRCAELRLDNIPSLRYRFLGRMSNAEVFRFYESNFVDCFVNLSESEGLPVSMMEAMSFGIPVVATDVGGVGEIVSPSSGILLGSQPLPVDVAEGIALVTLHSRDEHYRRGARSLWEDRFDADRNYREFCAHLQDLFVGVG